MKLEGRVAVVTGGGRGIGEAIVAGVAAEGAAVAVWDLDAGRAGAVAKGVGDEYGAPSVGLAVDIADPSSVERATEETERVLGPIAVLVNNAGIDKIGPFLESDEADWDRIIG